MLVDLVVELRIARVANFVVEVSKIHPPDCDYHESYRVEERSDSAPLPEALVCQTVAHLVWRTLEAAQAAPVQEEDLVCHVEMLKRGSFQEF